MGEVLQGRWEQITSGTYRYPFPDGSYVVATADAERGCYNLLFCRALGGADRLYFSDEEGRIEAYGDPNNILRCGCLVRAAEGLPDRERPIFAMMIEDVELHKEPQVDALIYG